MLISEIRQRRKNMELRKELQKRMLLNCHLRSMENSGKRMLQSVQSLQQKAIEAERAGDHEAAVRFASEMQRLAKHHRIADEMKDTVIRTYAISESTRALSGIMKDVHEMTENAAAPGTEEMIEMQLSMETSRESMACLMESAGEVFNSLAEINDPDPEEGEKALEHLLKAAVQDRRKSLLKETSKKLDAMTRSHAAE